MVLQLGGCGRVGDCRNNFCGEGPVRGGRGPFLYSWVPFSWAGLLSAPFCVKGGAPATGFVCGTPPLCVGLVGAGSHGPYAHRGRCRRIDNGPCAEGLSDQRPKSLENSPCFFGFSAGVSSSAGAARSESASEGAASPAVSSMALGAESVLPAAAPDAAASPETDGSGVPAGSACSSTSSSRSPETGLSAEPAVVSAASAGC